MGCDKHTKMVDIILGACVCRLLNYMVPSGQGGHERGRRVPASPSSPISPSCPGNVQKWPSPRGGTCSVCWVAHPPRSRYIPRQLPEEEPPNRGGCIADDPRVPTLGVAVRSSRNSSELLCSECSFVERRQKS